MADGEEEVGGAAGNAPGGVGGHKRLRVSDMNINRYLEEFVEIDEIASGVFGRVCVARHRLDGMVYAIKVIEITSYYTN